MSTVSDSSPLIFLAKIGCLDFLKTLFHKVFIPQQVYIDVVVKRRTKAGAKEVNKAINEAWIEVVDIKEKDKIEKLGKAWRIHQGETEAIVLAQSLATSLLLTDDDKVVLKARDLKITVVSTPGILLLAKREELISKVKEKANRLIEEGYWMTKEECENFLKEANEF
jgi:uncharacterized protein